LTERVREDESGDSENGDNDELPCVIYEVKVNPARLAKFHWEFIP